MDKPTYDMSKTSDARFLGKAVATKKSGIHAVGNPAYKDEEAFIVCPTCRRWIIFKGDDMGVQRIVCKKCDTTVLYKCIRKDVGRALIQVEKTSSDNSPESEQAPTAVEKPKRKTVRFRDSSHNLTNGKLVWGSFLMRKNYMLKVGENWIGRQDREDASDLMLKDEYMSRRSACLEVSQWKDDYSFKFTVHKACNPVKVNGRILEEGQSIYLNFNDYIEMGRTRFFFKEVN